MNALTHTHTHTNTLTLIAHIHKQKLYNYIGLVKTGIKTLH